MENKTGEVLNDENQIINEFGNISLGKECDKLDNNGLNNCEIESQIRSALSQQTIIQYRQYAAEQHPKEPHKQEELIKQLQEQYFQQYISQVYEVQKIFQKQQIEQLKALHIQQMEESGDNVNVDLDELYTPLALVPANLWTRKDLAEFKADIMQNQRECCIKIGSLSTATVRVPTHPDGRCVFWEFATDYYDLGFGVYFEWNIDPAENITVHISESSDEDEDEAEYDEESGARNSIEGAASTSAGTSSSADDVEREERGSSGRRGKHSNIPCDELIPVYRRDCHLEVYCGSHQYPGRGTYVLKFDNSYSVWRSKYLYYRVYYTK